MEEGGSVMTTAKCSPPGNERRSLSPAKNSCILMKMSDVSHPLKTTKGGATSIWYGAKGGPGPPDFSRGPEYFSKRITELYSTFLQDRILLVTEVLTDLASGKSIKDIHEHPPFPTHGSSPTGSSPHSP